MTTLCQGRRIGWKWGPVPRGECEGEVAAWESALFVPRQHLSGVQEGVSFGAQSVNAPFEEDELANDSYTEYDMDEDSGRDSARDVASLFCHVCEFLGCEDPSYDASSENGELGKEGEEGGDSKALECGDFLGFEILQNSGRVGLSGRVWSGIVGGLG